MRALRPDLEVYETYVDVQHPQVDEVVARQVVALMRRGEGARASGLDDAGAHTRRALRWHGFARAPLDALHRRCAADIARGSLRLLEACGE